MLTALALAGVPAPAAQAVAPATPHHSQHAGHAQHAQHSTPGAKPTADGCPCCKDTAAGGKMACCAGHGEGHGAGHSGHKADR
jgi:hypothetical protein